MANKKIIFHSDKPHLDIPHPQPSSRLIPMWYRKISGVTDRGIRTIKKCIPVLDSMTSGYMITLPVDVHWDSSTKSFAYDAKYSITSKHDLSQTDGFEMSDSFLQDPFKWINSFHIKTPKGYSSLFVHPLNRDDLPFYSFSGVVDSDKHPVITNFPFVMRKGFSGTIPAGTPIIQIIPFKRNNWKMQVVDQSKAHLYPMQHEIDTPPFNHYKRKWWSIKRYI